MEIKVVRSILESSERAAERIRAMLNEHGIYMINLMGSPGAGKTTLITALARGLGDLRLGVIEGDVETTMDAEVMARLGLPVVQINTSIFGGNCHLKPTMVESALNDMPLRNLDLVIVENIGNLICPASFDIGADLAMLILSIPEGED
ncbi:hydrogenase nickel incorporation protein HypB, partial [bacterium]|nr:hydrogenase nickel incorporation protein HypB [candidate division CSSED10-310 bacterium]